MCPFVFKHFRTLSPRLENIGTLECISESFPGTLTYLLFLENSWNSPPMCSSSPIQGTMSQFVLKFHVAKIWECNVTALATPGLLTYVTHDTWHMKGGGRWTFSENCSSLALTVWELKNMWHLPNDTVWDEYLDIWIYSNICRRIYSFV